MIDPSLFDLEGEDSEFVEGEIPLQLRRKKCQQEKKYANSVTTGPSKRTSVSASAARATRSSTTGKTQRRVL